MEASGRREGEPVPGEGAGVGVPDDRFGELQPDSVCGWVGWGEGGKGGHLASMSETGAPPLPLSI